jgi:hypothetical protein
MRKFCFALVLACLPGLAIAAARVVPAEPSAFELVNLRMEVDSCAFVPSSVNVTMVANTLRLTQQMNNCLLPGATQVVYVGLGMLPAGDYRVEIYGGSQPSAGSLVESFAFAVRLRPEVAIFPPPVHPLTNYSGLWYDPLESGWGLSIHQGPDGGLFAMLFVYGVNSQPDWFSIQGGAWSSSTAWTGRVFRTNGPPLANPVFDPLTVVYSDAGSVALDFKQIPGREGVAQLDYAIQGVSRTRFIQRMGL